MTNSNDEQQKYSVDKINELSKKLNRNLDTDTFCIQPFMHLSTTPNGQIRLCCRSQKLQMRLILHLKMFGIVII